MLNICQMYFIFKKIQEVEIMFFLCKNIIYNYSKMFLTIFHSLYWVQISRYVCQYLGQWKITLYENNSIFSSFMFLKMLNVKKKTMVTTTCVHIIKIIPYYENNVVFNSSITIKMIVKWSSFIWMIDFVQFKSNQN